MLADVPGPVLRRAADTDELIEAVRALIIPFIKAADDAVPERATGDIVPGPDGTRTNTLVDVQRPANISDALRLELPRQGKGKQEILALVERILKYSVNTWDAGFLDKLYSSTNAVGVMSEMVLSVLNTNLHVYQVSPALTVIEKQTARMLASLFGFTASHAGGVTCPGGSASNLTSLVLARNTLYPDSKQGGNAVTGPFVVFTSAHGHYSVEKSAVTCGIGSDKVIAIPVDHEGRMVPSLLEEGIVQAKSDGNVPLYVNATAGSTVLGSFDPLEDIAVICKRHQLWMHVDASWGGGAIFSTRRASSLRGSHLADSLTFNPHKMMNVPVTCSFLLVSDMRIMHRANTLAAGYLFHRSEADTTVNGAEEAKKDWLDEEVWDLADLTLQCGRRGDALKLALAWTYYGTDGFGEQVDRAFETAGYLAEQLEESGDFAMLGSVPPPCLQVCFYYAPGGKMAGDGPETNTARTREMAKRLVQRGFMVDFAPGEMGSFFRVVVNCQTSRGTADGLVKALKSVGKEVVQGQSVS